MPYDYKSDFIDVAPLVALAKARPGQVSYGSAGIGSGAHFNSEKFRIAAGIEALHVPYKGGAEALPHIRERRLLPLGVSSVQRSGLLPDTWKRSRATSVAWSRFPTYASGSPRSAPSR